MDVQAFQQWIAQVDALSAEQRTEVQRILSGRSRQDEVTAALEVRVSAERQCPHCQAGGAVVRGRANGLRRFFCRGCGKTFNALTGTPLAGLHYKERWLDFAQSLSEREVVRKSATRCSVAVGTAFRWRHRFLKAGKTDAAKLGGIVEADETYVLESHKGSRAWQQAAQNQPDAKPPERRARKRGGHASKRGLSHQQVPILMAADRSGATVTAILPAVTGQALADALRPAIQRDALLVTDGCTSFQPCARLLGISHETLTVSAGEHVRGDLHIQTVNSRHERFKDLLRRHRGVSTKYLSSYLNWFHLAVLNPNPAPRTCLNAAIGAHA